MENTLKIPVADWFAGNIIPITVCRVYEAKPFDTYAGIAAANGITEETLSSFNRGRILYPTCKVFIPE